MADKISVLYAASYLGLLITGNKRTTSIAEQLVSDGLLKKLAEKEYELTNEGVEFLNAHYSKREN